MTCPAEDSPTWRANTADQAPHTMLCASHTPVRPDLSHACCRLHLWCIQQACCSTSIACSAWEGLPTQLNKLIVMQPHMFVQDVPDTPASPDDDAAPRSAAAPAAPPRATPSGQQPPGSSERPQRDVGASLAPASGERQAGRGQQQARDQVGCLDLRSLGPDVTSSFLTLPVSGLPLPCRLFCCCCRGTLQARSGRSQPQSAEQVAHFDSWLCLLQQRASARGQTPPATADSNRELARQAAEHMKRRLAQQGLHQLAGEQLFPM